MRSMLFEGRCLKPSARTLWEVQAFAQRPPVEAATNLYTSIRDRAMVGGAIWIPQLMIL